MDVVNGKCDCPVRTKGNELYWNGADCVPANTYGGSCSSAELFKCQTLTLGLTCINNKCDCKDGVWDPVKGECRFCSSGWYFLRGGCYRGAWTPPDFGQTKVQNPLQKLCYNIPSGVSGIWKQIC